MDPTLGRFPIVLEQPVVWGEMDALGHVNNTVYVRWFESARMAYFEAMGMLAEMNARRVGPILARQELDYRAPVTYPDRVRTAVTVTKLGNTSFTMACRMVSQTQGLAAEGTAVIVMVDYTNGTKVPLDAALRARFVALEARGTGAPT